MKEFIWDILNSLKISVYFYIPCFIIGLIIGFFSHSSNLNSYVIWGCRLTELAGALGMAIAAVAFTKRSLMRPLDYHDTWKTYFNKFNLAHVVFFVSVFMVAISFSIEYIIRPV